MMAVNEVTSSRSCDSIDIQIPADDDMARIARSHFVQQLRGGGANAVDSRPPGNGSMIENQQARLGLCSELGELHCRSVIFRSIVLEIGALRKPFQREHFVDQHVAAMAGVDSSRTDGRMCLYRR